MPTPAPVTDAGLKSSIVQIEEYLRALAAARAATDRQIASLTLKTGDTGTPAQTIGGDADTFGGSAGDSRPGAAAGKLPVCK